MIGYKFMGKAHTQAWARAGQVFSIDARPILHTVCGKTRGAVEAFASRWGWNHTSLDWREVVDHPEIDVIDICVPQYLHFDIALAALQAGKHVFCEKPLTLTVDQAHILSEEAQSRPELVHYVNHNYRRLPAVGLAKQMIDQGKVGRIYHWRGAYLQDWIIDPQFPLTWHLRKETSGMGPQGDLNSHSVDLARFLVGDITAVTCMAANFITQRPLPDEAASGTFSGTRDESGAVGEVSVEDAAFMLARFDNGALGSFETSRFAAGRKNYNSFEIYGSRGSLMFNFERMNELEFYSMDDPPEERGFKTILVTESEHPYMSGWWPPGHGIGYEHTFVHAAADFINAVVRGESIKPDFHDGLQIQRILEAGLESASRGREIKL